MLDGTASVRGSDYNGRCLQRAVSTWTDASLCVIWIDVFLERPTRSTSSNCGEGESSKPAVASVRRAVTILPFAQHSQTRIELVLAARTRFFIEIDTTLGAQTAALFITDRLHRNL